MILDVIKSATSFQKHVGDAFIKVNVWMQCFFFYAFMKVNVWMQFLFRQLKTVPVVRQHNSFFEKELTLYQTITGFNDPEVQVYSTHYGNRRKCWLPSFSLSQLYF